MCGLRVGSGDNKDATLLGKHGEIRVRNFVGLFFRSDMHREWNKRGCMQKVSDLVARHRAVF